MNQVAQNEAFLQLLAAHEGIIFKISNLYCRNAEDRKDLAQEIIIQLWTSFDRYDPTFKASTWIYRIALNVAISFYRKSERRRKNLPTENNFVDIAAKNPTDELKETQLHLLHQFIQQLNDLNKALMLLYLEGHSHQEISGILGLSVSNVGTKINRIKNQMKLQFKQPVYSTNKPEHDE